MTPPTPAPAAPSVSSVPEKDQFYRRRCLVDSNCPTEEKESALYDYVGAVYGAQGEVVFGKPGGQQVLTAKEKSYVVSKFGLLEGGRAQDITAYLTRARVIFFKDLNFPVEPACRGTAEVWPVSLSHQDFGAA